MNKFETTGRVGVIETPVQLSHSSRSDSGTSQNRARQCCRESTKGDLHMQAYKIRLTQELKPTDRLQLRQSVDWILVRQRMQATIFQRQ